MGNLNFDKPVATDQEIAQRLPQERDAKRAQAKMFEGEGLDGTIPVGTKRISQPVAKQVLVESWNGTAWDTIFDSRLAAYTRDNINSNTTDWNTVTTPGFYVVDGTSGWGTTNNSPDPGVTALHSSGDEYAWGVLLVSRGLGATMQMFIPHSGVGRIAYRVGFDSNTWMPWQFAVSNQGGTIGGNLTVNGTLQTGSSAAFCSSGTTGYVIIQPGTSGSGSIPGYVGFMDVLGVRWGYVGWSTDGTDVVFQAENGKGVTVGTGSSNTKPFKVLAPAQFQQRAYTTKASIAYASSITVDATLSNFFVIGTLTGNITVAMSNPVEGQVLTLRFRQDATGSRTVTLPAGSSVSGSLNSAANKTSYLTMTWNATDSRWDCSWTQQP